MKKYFILLLFVFSCGAFAQDSILLKIYREQANNKHYIYVDNKEWAPVSLEYSFTSENLNSTLPDKSVVVIPARTEKFTLTELNVADKKRGTKFSYDVYSVLGDVNVSTISHDFIYSLPFEKNKKHKIYQGYNGKFSHQNTYSLDFSLQTGDIVTAARGGKVISVVAENSKNCLTRDCARYNNRIVILHDDGTLGEYVHLKQNGSTVKPGDVVNTGQTIGYSGNTGWSKGPHLHFSVYINNIDGTRKYLKTKFAVAENKTPVYLSEGQYYTRKL